MTFKCINCSWEGDTLSEKPLKGKCPVCGDNVSGKGKEPLIPKVDISPEKKSRIKDFVEDILDDGKRNRSNRKKKKKVN